MTEHQRLELLRAIEADPLVEHAELAVRLGVQAAEVASELANLEEAGVIKGYRALIDWDRLQTGAVHAFVDVHVNPEAEAGFDAIARRIARFEEVHSLHLVSGGRDLLVVVRGQDFKEVALFVAEKLAPIKGVTRTTTSFVLRTYKTEGTALLSATEDTRLAIAP